MLRRISQLIGLLFLTACAVTAAALAMGWMMRQAPVLYPAALGSPVWPVAVRDSVLGCAVEWRQVRRR